MPGPSAVEGAIRPKTQTVGIGRRAGAGSARDRGRGQLLGLGLDSDAIKRRVRAGRLHADPCGRVRGGAYGDHEAGAVDGGGARFGPWGRSESPIRGGALGDLGIGGGGDACDGAAEDALATGPSAATSRCFPTTSERSSPASRPPPRPEPSSTSPRPKAPPRRRARSGRWNTSDLRPGLAPDPPRALPTPQRHADRPRLSREVGRRPRRPHPQRSRGSLPPLPRCPSDPPAALERLDRPG